MKKIRINRRLKLIGKRFYKLKIISFSHMHKKSSTTYWNCLCDCGNLAVVRGSTLKEGLTKSCGCAKGYKNPKKSSINYVYKRYEQQAKKRSLSFNLSKKKFKELIFSECYYCGEKHSNRVDIKKCKGNIKYNGIDRKNNSNGYSLKNCVPCCKICNFLKKGDSHDIFLNTIKKIYEYRIK